MLLLRWMSLGHSADRFMPLECLCRFMNIIILGWVSVMSMPTATQVWVGVYGLIEVAFYFILASKWCVVLSSYRVKDDYNWNLNSQRNRKEYIWNCSHQILGTLNLVRMHFPNVSTAISSGWSIHYAMCIHTMLWTQLCCSLFAIPYLAGWPWASHD